MQQINVIITNKLIDNFTKIKLTAFLLIGLIVVNVPILKYSYSYTQCEEKQTLLVLQSNFTCNR